MNHKNKSSLVLILILITTIVISAQQNEGNIITQLDINTPSENLQVERWNIFELKLAGPRNGNPFVDVELSAEFKNNGKIYKPHGFYDGNGTYKIRFMPTELGKWFFTTESNVEELDGIEGSFISVHPSENNHGPVRVRNNFYFAYEDGTPYFQIGTTCYAWTHQGNEMEEKTLETLAEAPFNKLRMCIFPKDYVYNKNEPVYYPFEGDPPKNWDFTRFNPEFWRHFETRVMDLMKLGIEADIIFFHTYDRWGFEYMDRESDTRYLRYALARLSAFRNVWWSLANEYDFMPEKNEADWDHFFRIVQKDDPYQHLRSIHNGSRWYDHNKPWVTHASIQSSDMNSGISLRKRFQKPVIFDECKYEGNIPHGWGQLTPGEMVNKFWQGTISGCYVGHGETYLHPDDILWWSKGGVLHGKSPERIAFLKNFISGLSPYEEMKPMGDDKGNFILGVPGKLYLVYGSTSGNTVLELAGDVPYKIDVIDTWNMTESPYGTAEPGEYRFASPRENLVFRFTPYAPGEKIRPGAVASADVLSGTAPLKVNFSASTGTKVNWDFGDGLISDEVNPAHIYKNFGRYLVTLTVEDENGLSASTAIAVTVFPPVPEDLQQFKSWPGSDSDLQFVWKNENNSNTIKIRGDAKINDDGEMEIVNGAFTVDGINGKLLKACKKTNQLTIEAVVTSSGTDQTGPARIISFSNDAGSRNFTLGQEGKNIVMRLRTPRTGANGLNPQVTVCPIIPNESMHIIVSYYPGNLFCYVNGELVYQGSDINGDFSNWEACFLIFGDEMTGNRNWKGKINNISIYNRFVGPAEAGYKYKLLNEK